MKKLSVFLLASLFALALSAQQVHVRTNGNYEMKIDGRGYYSNTTLSNLGQGFHTVQVYQVSNGLFGIRKRTLVSTSSFELRNYDVTLYVDNYGQLRVFDGGNSNRDPRYDDHNYPNDRDTNYRNKKGNGRGYGPYDNPGRGHKYGLYKNKKSKGHKHDDDRDDDDRWDD